MVSEDQSMEINNLKFNSDGLIPCIVQDYENKEVLMLGYMNEESIKITLDEKRVCFYSRSRQELWRKGETSGHTQELKSLYYDCDKDTLLALVNQKGVACHTGKRSCFFEKLYGEEKELEENILIDLYSTIFNRRDNPIEGSYTNYLFNEGIDKICKKIGEESTEIVIASKNNSKEELIYEISDFVYHLSVLMVEKGINFEDIEEELIKRHSNKRKRNY